MSELVKRLRTARVPAGPNDECPGVLCALAADEIERMDDVCPYFAHHQMAERLAGPCECSEDSCRGSSLCITEYCVPCYASWWLEAHAAEFHRDQGATQ